MGGNNSRLMKSVHATSSDLQVPLAHTNIHIHRTMGVGRAPLPGTATLPGENEQEWGECITDYTRHVVLWPRDLWFWNHKCERFLHPNEKMTPIAVSDSWRERTWNRAHPPLNGEKKAGKRNSDWVTQTPQRLYLLTRFTHLEEKKQNIYGILESKCSFQGMSIFISTLTLTAIAVDRYFVIVSHSPSINANDRMSMRVRWRLRWIMVVYGYGGLRLRYFKVKATVL